MNWKFSANASFFGLRRDRFTQYQPHRSLEEKFELVTQVDGITGIELKYPADFEDVALLKRLLEDHGLWLMGTTTHSRLTMSRRGGASSRL
jgi:sugar phosphate isomerase/epimerase